VERFTNIIRGQLFGHTHNDHIEIIKSFNDGTPVGSVFIAPSFTTYYSQILLKLTFKKDLKACSHHLESLKLMLKLINP